MFNFNISSYVSYSNFRQNFATTIRNWVIHPYKLMYTKRTTRLCSDVNVVIAGMLSYIQEVCVRMLLRF